MTADHERRLLARAGALADTEDLAEEVTEVLGGGRAARLDPDALRSLAQCALALGANRLAVYRASGPAPRDDAAFLAAIAEADAELTARAGATTRLAQEAAAALDAAREDLAAARRRLAAAKAMPLHQPCDGCHTAREAAITAAQDATAAAADRAGYARDAVNVLSDLAERLRVARSWIRQAPGELGDTYEAVYELLRRGHAMPRDGDFITGEDHTSNSPARAAGTPDPYPCADCLGSGTSRLTAATCQRCSGSGQDPYALAPAPPRQAAS